MKTAEENDSIYILANDPDADRLAVAECMSSDRSWKIFNGNEIGTLLAWWQLQVHLNKHSKDEFEHKNLYFIASAVSSKMLGAIARKEGLSFEVSLERWHAFQVEYLKFILSSKP